MPEPVRPVVLGVGGGIAAYKAVELARRLRQADIPVETVLSRSAQRFVTPLTFAAAAGGPCWTDADWWRARGEVLHVELAERALAVVLCPATADLLARVSLGLADELLTAFLLAYPGRGVFAPAMEAHMWAHEAVQGHAAALERRGWRRVGPEEGALASGRSGVGRMAEPEAIAAAVKGILGPQDLVGQKVVVTAGPTREPIDPVRYLTNRSSGRMGIALAEAARDRGAEVILVLGPTHLPPPSGVKVVRAETAAQMLAAVQEAFASGGVTVFVGAAAVADVRPEAASSRKLAKEDLPRELPLAPTEDIVAWVSSHRGQALVVGFAAQTGDPLPSARDKLRRKGLDLVVANDVLAPGAGFEVETNQVTLVWEGGEEGLPLLPKRAVADRIWDRILWLLHRRRT